MEQQMRVGLAQPPVGGARVAWSYLGALLGLVVGGLAWAAWTPFGSMVCAPDDLVCDNGWLIAGGLLGASVGLAVPALVLRLGWEWWALLAVWLLGAPLWVDAVPPAAPVVVALLAPALAAAATWSGPRRARWRPVLVGGLLALVVTLSALVLLV